MPHASIAATTQVMTMHTCCLENSVTEPGQIVTLFKSRTMGEPCGLSCATALRGARRSYSSTDPAEVVATMSGWCRETARRFTTVLGSAAGPLSSMGICTEQVAHDVSDCFQSYKAHLGACALQCKMCLAAI